MTIDVEMLMAFADGELSGPEREAVERALAGDAGLRALLAEQQRLRARLSDHYGPVASEDVPERLLALLGAQGHESLPSLSAARQRRRSVLRPAWRNFGAIAATLAVGVLAGQLIPRGNGPVEVANGALVARGDLAAALDTQLASAPNGDSATRIGLTFADRRGRACRTFESPATSGLACHDGDGWALVMTAARESQGTEYRQAGSSPILEAAQEMMVGEPMDAAAERALRQRAWEISPGRAD